MAEPPPPEWPAPAHGPRLRRAARRRGADWAQRLDAIRFWLVIGTVIVVVWVTVPVQAAHAAPAAVRGP